MKATPFVQDADFTLYHGNALDTLRTLDAGSVHCCVTSPPYWGLRDYGTGAWEGGDADCDHIAGRGGHLAESAASTRGGANKVAEAQTVPMKAECGKCGARRVDQQLGLEATPDEYVARMVEVFREVRRVLRDDGTVWLNLADSFSDKQMAGVPWRVAFALQADGWYLRSDIIWSKPNPMPESVTDRPTKAHEYVFLLSKSPRYYFDQDAVREGYKYDGRKVLDREAGAGSHPNHRTNGGKRNRWPGIGQASHEARATLTAHGHDESEPMEINHAGRNVRSVWEIATQPYPEAHFATFPEELPRRCIAAGCPEGVCATCGRPLTADVILTPTGNGPSADPTMQTGRKGMNRVRRDGEGVRPISRAAQRDYAQQLRHSPHRPDMEAEAGEAFAHYIRTDDSGARPVPPALLDAWIERDWIRPTATPSTCCDGRETPGVVLDPFGGSGTTALVARKLNRRSILIELNAEYCQLAARRLQQQSLFAEVAS